MEDRRRLAPLLAALLLSGCDILGIAYGCTSELRFGLSITVEDATTGGRLTAPEMRITVRDGAFIEETTFGTNAPRPGPVGMVGERRGTYRITIVAQGYEPWVREGVRVTADPCDVRTVHVHARLLPP